MLKERERKTQLFGALVMLLSFFLHFYCQRKIQTQWCPFAANSLLNSTFSPSRSVNTTSNTRLDVQYFLVKEDWQLAGIIKKYTKPLLKITNSSGGCGLYSLTLQFLIGFLINAILFIAGYGRCNIEARFWTMADVEGGLWHRRMVVGLGLKLHFLNTSNRSLKCEEYSDFWLPPSPHWYSIHYCEFIRTRD